MQSKLMSSASLWCLAHAEEVVPSDVLLVLMGPEVRDQAWLFER